MWQDDEWLQRFDILYNNITSNQAPGLNPYEICVFLTKGQDEIVKNHYTPNSKGNALGQGFDDSPKRQIDFSMLTTSQAITAVSTAAKFDGRSNSKSITLPTDIMTIINERVEVTRDGSTVSLVVIPLRFDEYNRLMSKPYKRPLRDQAWRLIDSDSANKADVIVGPGDSITKYVVRYIRTPKPIIVSDLDGLTINGYTYGTGSNQTKGCELDPMLYEEILQRAVELAKTAWTTTGGDNTQMVLQTGTRSE